MKIAIERDVDAAGLVTRSGTDLEALTLSVRGIERVVTARNDAVRLAEIFEIDPSALKLRKEIAESVDSARARVDEVRARVREGIMAQLGREIEMAVERATYGAVSEVSGTNLLPEQLESVLATGSQSAGASKAPAPAPEEKAASEPVKPSGMEDFNPTPEEVKAIEEKARENARRLFGDTLKSKGPGTAPVTAAAPAPKPEAKTQSEKASKQSKKDGKLKIRPVIFDAFCGGRSVRYDMPDVFGLGEGSIGAFELALVEHLKTLKRCPLEQRSMALRTAQGTPTHKELTRYVRVAGQDFNYLIDLASDEVMSGAGDTGAWTLGQILSQRQLNVRDFLTLFHYASIRMAAFTDQVKDTDAKALFERLNAEEKALDHWNTGNDRPGWANGAYALLKAYLGQTRELWKTCRGWEIK